jgi:hypothetical protein
LSVGEIDHPKPDDVWPTNWGDSTGCWTGRTLVIDTIDVKYDAQFNPSAPPLSDKAHFVERMRLVAPGRIESDVTVTDPATLEKPWKTKIVFIHPKGLDRLVHEGDFLENDRTVSRFQAGAHRTSECSCDWILREWPVENVGRQFLHERANWSGSCHRFQPKLERANVVFAAESQSPLLAHRRLSAAQP